MKKNCQIFYKWTLSNHISNKKKKSYRPCTTDELSRRKKSCKYKLTNDSRQAYALAESDIPTYYLIKKCTNAQVKRSKAVLLPTNGYIFITKSTLQIKLYPNEWNWEQEMVPLESPNLANKRNFHVKVAMSSKDVSACNAQWMKPSNHHTWKSLNYAFQKKYSIILIRNYVVMLNVKKVLLTVSKWNINDKITEHTTFSPASIKEIGLLLIIWRTNMLFCMKIFAKIEQLAMHGYRKYFYFL